MLMAHLALGVAEDVDAGDARHALEPFLDDVDDEVAVGDHLPVLPGSRVSTNHAIALSSVPDVDSVGSSASSG